MATSLVAKPARVSADTGDNLVLGADNTADITTRLTMTDTSTFEPALEVAVTDVATGIKVSAVEGVGIRAWLSNVDPPPPVGQTAVFAGADAHQSFTALKVEGRVTFSRSGRAKIAAGRSQVQVTVPGSLQRRSFAVATLNSNRRGVFVQSVVLNFKTGAKNTLTIYLNKPTPYGTLCAWIVFN